MFKFIYKVKYPVKWNGFTFQPGFLVLKDAWNRMYFASGWTFSAGGYTYLYVYTAIDGEYVGRWVDVDAIENLPDVIREVA